MSRHFDPQGRHEDLITLVQTMHCGIIGRGTDGLIEYMNSQLLEWLGYSREELLHKPAEIITPPELHDLIRDEMQAVQDGDERVRLSVLRRKNGTTFPVVSVPHRLYDEFGVYLGGFAILVDLGAVQTAKPAGYSPDDDVRGTLSRIAMELQSISLVANLPSATPIPIHHPALEDVSPRELEVLTHLVAGGRVPAIAGELHISPHTVRNHLKAMYRKLEVQNQSELIQYVRALGESGASSEE